MSSVYLVLACAVALLTLGAAVFGAGRTVGRREQHEQEIDRHLAAQDKHLEAQDEEIAALHSKLDALQKD